MEATSIPLEAEAQFGDESVRVDDHSHSIRDVDREEAHSDSGSVITGVVSIVDASDTDDEGDRAVETTKLQLPEEFAESVMVLTCDSSADGGSCDVYLIGTAHVSEESCREAEAIVSFMKPEVVFVELCSSRLSISCNQKLNHLKGERERVSHKGNKIRLNKCYDYIDFQ